MKSWNCTFRPGEDPCKMPTLKEETQSLTCYEEALQGLQQLWLVMGLLELVRTKKQSQKMPWSKPYRTTHYPAKGVRVKEHELFTDLLLPSLCTGLSTRTFLHVVKSESLKSICKKMKIFIFKTETRNSTDKLAGRMYSWVFDIFAGSQILQLSFSQSPHKCPLVLTL